MGLPRASAPGRSRRSSRSSAAWRSPRPRRAGRRPNSMSRSNAAYAVAAQLSHRGLPWKALHRFVTRSLSRKLLRLEMGVRFPVWAHSPLLAPETQNIRANVEPRRPRHRPVVEPSRGEDLLVSQRLDNRTRMRCEVLGEVECCSDTVFVGHCKQMDARNANFSQR
jgi:hypothetical protein